MLRTGAILFVLVVASILAGSTAAELFFAQSAGFSGPRASFGIELRHGIEAAFFEANEAQILSVNLTLHSMDDVTEKTLAFNNTRDFLANTTYSYFALVGETASGGAEGALEARKISAYPDIPFIGPLTGAKFLRNPFVDTIVNVRASFIDEANAIVKFLVALGKNRISMIYQNDTAGGNVYEGFQIALDNSELLAQSVALFPKGANATVVKNAARDTFQGHNVQACIIFALAPDVAMIINTTRQEFGAQNVLFFTLSYNDVDQLFNLTVNQYGQSINNIFATQVVPPPYSDDLPLLGVYRSALTKYFPDARPTYKSLEGYIVGRLIVEVLDRVRGNILDYHSFYEALYRSQIFFLDGLVLGPFGNSSSFECNQGARQVYLTQLHEDGNFTLVPGFEYKWNDACLSSRSSIVQSKILAWGQSCDLTGPRSEMGREINLGLLVAFDEANRLNLLPGYKFELIAMNDMHTGALAVANTDYLINTRRVMGMVGVTGTGPASEALDFMNNNGSTIPYVGAWSGDSKFRTPFQRNVVNTRISFIDEASAMVEWASNQLITHFGMVREDSTYGAATQRALEIALNATGLSIRAWATWNPNNNATIRTACEAVLGSGVPDAVMIAGVDAFAAQAVHECRKTKQGATVKYFYFSTVGAAAVIRELRDVWNDSFKDVYFAASYPPAAAVDSHPIVQSYKNALESYFPGASMSLEGLEGYINGRLIVTASSRIRGEITSATFLDSIYGSQLFVIDKEMLGPYVDNGVGSNQSCNQGMHRVYLIQLHADGTTPIVPGSDFSWEGTCQSNSENVHLPIIFGQSAPLSGSAAENGINYRNGILAAFNRFNRNGGLDGHSIKLNTYDDKYIPEKAVNNTLELMDSNVVALLGYVGAPMAGPAMEYAKARKVPFIAPYSGAHVFREPCSKYVINMRASYWDEIAGMIAFLLDDDKAALRGNRTIMKIAAFSQVDPYGPYYSGAVRALAHRKMELSGIGEYQIGTLDVEAGLDNITLGGTPDAIIVHGTYEPAAKFIKLAQARFGRKTVFMVLSFVGAVSLSDHLKELEGVYLTDGTANNYPTIYIGAVVPSPFDATHPLVTEYQSEMKIMGLHPGYLTLEGYAVGRLVTRAIQLVEGELSPRSLAEAIYEKFMFNLNEFYLGPYTLVSTSSTARNRTASQNETLDCTCNQGSHQIWLTYIDTDYNITEIKSFEYIFDTCGVVFEVLINQVLDVGLKGLVLALAVLAMVVVIVCFILVLVYRETKTMTASSPVFLMIILLGAFLLSLSPFFAVQWNLGGDTSNNVCMTWIWMLGLGFTLFFAPLAVKTYRVYRIFNNRVLSHVITLKDSDLMLYLAVPVVIEVVLLIVWTAVAPAQLMTVRIPGTVDQTMQLCTTANAADQPLIIAQAVFFGLVAIAACFFAFRTRNIKYGAFKESTEILFAAYNLTFLSVILVPLHAGLSFYVIPSTIIRTIGVVFQVLVSLGALFGMKLYRIITNNEKMSTTTRHSGYSSRGPLSFSSTSGSSHTKSSKTTTTTSSTTKSSRSTATTSTTTTSSRTSSSTRSSNSSSSTTSSGDSDSDSDSSSSSKKKDKNDKKEKKPAEAKPAAPKPKAVAPGGKLTSEIMTEPSDEEPEPETKKKKKQKKEDVHELEEMQHDEPEKPSKSSVLPKWISPKSKRKGEKKDKEEIVFVHHDGDEEPATEPSDDEEEHPADAEKKPLSPKKSRKNKDDKE